MIRLNLGCFDLPLDGWINVDNGDDPRVKADLKADALDLSAHFKPSTVDEIYAGHLVEHLYPEEAEKAVSHWRDLLKPGGKLGIMTPDFRYLCHEFLGGGIPLEDMIDIYVFSYHQPSHHRSLWDQESLFKLLARHGLKDVRIIDRMNNEYSPYGVEWQCGASGIR